MENHDILVAGKIFLESEWRNAIRFFLDGIQGEKKEVMLRPEINFGNKVVISFNTQFCDGYRAYGDGANEAFSMDVTTEQHLLAQIGWNCDKYNLEAVLARFLKNNRIRLLKIYFAGPADTRSSCIWICKKRERGQYGIRTENLRKNCPNW